MQLKSFFFAITAIANVCYASSDCAKLLELLTNSSNLRTEAGVEAYLKGTKTQAPAYSISHETQRLIIVYINSDRSRRFLFSKDGKFVGTASYIKKSKSVQIPISIKRSFQRQKLAYEAKKALIDEAFSDSEVLYIVDNISRTNKASIKLHQKLGFKKSTNDENSNEWRLEKINP